MLMFWLIIHNNTKNACYKFMNYNFINSFLLVVDLAVREIVDIYE